MAVGGHRVAERHGPQRLQGVVELERPVVAGRPQPVAAGEGLGGAGRQPQQVVAAPADHVDRQVVAGQHQEPGTAGVAERQAVPLGLAGAATSAWPRRPGGCRGRRRRCPALQMRPCGWNWLTELERRAAGRPPRPPPRGPRATSPSASAARPADGNTIGTPPASATSASRLLVPGQVEPGAGGALGPGAVDVGAGHERPPVHRLAARASVAAVTASTRRRSSGVEGWGRTRCPCSRPGPGRRPAVRSTPAARASQATVPSAA